MRRMHDPVVSIAICGAFALGAPAVASSGVDESVVADMIADASARSSLLLEESTSGYDGGFVIRDQQGRHELEITGWTQLRFTYAYGHGEGGAPDTNESGFSLRRTRLTFQGSLYDGQFGFKITNSFSRNTGSSSLSDAYMTVRLADHIELRAGQFKLPFMREELTSAKRLMATDRSIVNDVFGQGRSQGIEISAQGESVRGAVAYSDGFDSANTDFDAAPAQWAVTGRVEWLAMGDWRSFRQFTSSRGSELSAMFGAAANFQESPDAPGMPSLYMFSWTVDGGLQGNGFSLFASASGRVSQETNATYHDYGWVAQASMYATDHIEPFVRFDMVIPDSDRPGDDPFNTLAIGANWYIHGQAIKLTVDGQYFFDDAADNDLVNPTTTQGLLAGAGSGSFAVRAQFQFVF